MSSDRENLEYNGSNMLHFLYESFQLGDLLHLRSNQCDSYEIYLIESFNRKFVYKATNFISTFPRKMFFSKNWLLNVGFEGGKHHLWGEWVIELE